MNLADIIPVVLRSADGGRTQAQLEVISLNGGLLALPKPVQRDSHVTLTFVMPTGPVLSTAAMLEPVSINQQPFRFVSLAQDDRQRLQESIQSWCGQASSEQEWIQKYRATLAHRQPERKRPLGMPLAAVTLTLLSLGSAIYFFGVFNFHPK